MTERAPHVVARDIDAHLVGIRRELDSLWYHARDAVAGHKEFDAAENATAIDDRAYRVLHEVRAAEVCAEELRDLGPKPASEVPS